MFRKIILILVFLLTVVSSVIAGPLGGQLYRGVLLQSVYVQDALNSKKYFLVKTASGPVTGNADYYKPDCHTGPVDRVIWDLNDPASKAAYSLALTAYAAGKKVDIDAYNTCIDGMATVRNIYFSEQQ